MFVECSLRKMASSSSLLRPREVVFVAWPERVAPFLGLWSGDRRQGGGTSGRGFMGSLPVVDAGFWKAVLDNVFFPPSPTSLCSHGFVEH